ncbi:MAG: HAMP domain-containing sensor histidine kinase [Polyangiaceae bacterium]
MDLPSGFARRTLSPEPRPVRTGALRSWMVLAILAVAAFAYWDEQREFSAALHDFASEQTAIAKTIATTLPNASSAARAAERPHSVRVFIQEPSRAGLFTADDRSVRSAAIEAGFRSGVSWLRLSRVEAADLGLPSRTAMAGLTTVDTGVTGHWGIAVVASAERERDREVFAEWRLGLSVFVASGLVLAFGGLAQRNQRKQLLLAQQLAVAAVASERDERLVRADKLATMGALATGIAHEVSTPLGVIVGRAEQLRSKLGGDERSRRAVEAIAEQAERISAIVRGFLALARGDSPHTEQISPRALGEVAVDLVAHRFAKAQVGLSTSFADGLPGVACEPRLMEQVLVNLLLNACDACQPGGQVELRVLAEGQRVAFVVTDDGSGISADAAARILDPFFTTKPIGEGSGLGLAIANELVKHHRGTLSVAARSGHKGTRACVELPSATEGQHA